jgi:hypothetical protein
MFLEPSVRIMCSAMQGLSFEGNTSPFLQVVVINTQLSALCSNISASSLQ